MAGKLEKVLYVEDEADIRAIAELALGKVGGFQVLVCASGPEAIRKAAAFAPDIMLLDVMMPGMDGTTTLEALRDLPGLAAVPAVFLTAKALPAEIARYKTLGASDVIAKPFDPMKLSEQVRAIWQRAGR
jgi:CheY-like chemotaxis protein